MAFTTNVQAESRGSICRRRGGEATKVTFASSVRVKPIRPLSDMSQDEMDAVWFTDEECRAMESELRDVVLSIREEASSPENDSSGSDRSTSLMGLHYVCDDDAYEAHVSRVEAGINAVLLEQGRQRSLRVIDEEALARAYSDATAESRMEARTRGVCYLDDDEDGPPDDDAGARRRPTAASCADDHQDSSEKTEPEINAQMAVSATASSSFKKAERRGLTRSRAQRRLRDAPIGSLSINVSRPKGRGGHCSTPGGEASNSSLSSFEIPLTKTPSTKSIREQRNKSSISTKKLDTKMKMSSKNIRAVTARIALSRRCAIPSRPKSYVALGA